MVVLMQVCLYTDPETLEMMGKLDIVECVIAVIFDFGLPHLSLQVKNMLL